MAYRVKLTPRAQRDLTSIYERINANSSDAAYHWYLGLRDAIRSLRATPRRCPVIPESGAFRHLLYGNKPHIYRIIYRIMDRERQVEVLHIRHGAMDRFPPGELMSQ